MLVYTLEATFATQFWWNFVRMFVLTISRPSLNIGHVGSKSRSPGQILGNSNKPSLAGDIFSLKMLVNLDFIVNIYYILARFCCRCINLFRQMCIQNQHVYLHCIAKILTLSSALEKSYNNYYYNKFKMRILNRHTFRSIR